MILLSSKCNYCNKTFHTYEKDKIYCSTTCISKEKYDKTHPNDEKVIKRKLKVNNCCLECGNICDRKYCDRACREKFASNKKKSERLKNSRDLNESN